MFSGCDLYKGLFWKVMTKKQGSWTTFVRFKAPTTPTNHQTTKLQNCFTSLPIVMIFNVKSFLGC